MLGHIRFVAYLFFSLLSSFCSCRTPSLPGAAAATAQAYAASSRAEVAAAFSTAAFKSLKSFNVFEELVVAEDEEDSELESIVAEVALALPANGKLFVSNGSLFLSSSHPWSFMGCEPSADVVGRLR